MTSSVVDNVFTRHDREYNVAVKHTDSSPAVAIFYFLVVLTVEVKS